MLTSATQRAARGVHTIRFVQTLLAQIREPSAERVIALERLAVRLARPDDIDGYLRAARAAPATERMLRERFLPAPYTVDSLARCEPGTLGHSYRRHMVDNGLSADFFPPIEPQTDDAYYRLRMFQTHDIWHALLGYPATTEGEAGIIGFYLGHFDRHMGRDGHRVMAFTAMLAATLCMHAAFIDTSHLRPYFRAINDGWRRGQRALPLMAEHWEEMWDVPLVDLRARYRIDAVNAAASSAYDAHHDADRNPRAADQPS
jgi:ubiquinone biosynthesis protein Coq4